MLVAPAVETRRKSLCFDSESSLPIPLPSRERRMKVVEEESELSHRMSPGIELEWSEILIERDASSESERVTDWWPEASTSRW
jgi:hypothetical protein